MRHDKADTDVLSRKVLPPGQVIFRAEDPGLSAYLIRRGTVEIYKQDGGEDITIAQLGAGEMFGEMALFNAGRRSTFARAGTACELVLITGDKLENLVASAEPGLKALVRVLVQRMADLNDRIETCPMTGKFRIREDRAAA
jgi:CRP-like cAMP-binding protein